ncbi:MAG: hypothetical protein HYY44_06195 [Deltaproteobacteria bacterium]|nr:hypothetical protein [Deltaproteobacteria bacterium]
MTDVTVSWKPPKKKIPAPVFILLSVAIAGSIFFGYQKRHVPMPEKEVPSQVQVQAQPVGLGSLSFQVIPWGQVMVDNKDSYESPLHRLPLSEGVHHLKVSYGGSKDDFETSVEIRSGVHLVCFSTLKKRSVECH